MCTYENCMHAFMISCARDLDVHACARTRARRRRRVYVRGRGARGPGRTHVIMRMHSFMISHACMHMHVFRIHDQEVNVEFILMRLTR